jgi:hypothetical protein
MARKKKKTDEEVQVFKFYQLDGSFPELTSKVIIKKSKKARKKRNVKNELENTIMDMIQ